MSISANPSSAPLPDGMGPERLLEWTRGVNLSLPNLEKRPLLGGAEDPDRVAQGLLRHCPGVVLELGAGGALYASADGERVRLPALPVRVVDTTGGAGDALSAGFLIDRLSGAPPDRAL